MRWDPGDGNAPAAPRTTHGRRNASAFSCLIRAKAARPRAVRPQDDARESSGRATRAPAFWRRRLLDSPPARRQRSAPRLRLQLRPSGDAARLFTFPEIPDALGIEIERVEEQAAGRAVGAGVLRVVQKQRMQGIESDHVGAASGPLLQHQPQVGEVATAPVALGAHRVELHRRSPDAPAGLQAGRLVAGIRGDDQRMTRRGARPAPSAGADGSQAGLALERQAPRHELSSLHRGTLDFRQVAVSMPASCWSPLSSAQLPAEARVRPTPLEAAA